MLKKEARLVRPYSGCLCQQETPDPLLSKTSVSRGYSGFNSLNSKGCTRGSTFRFRGWSHAVQEASMTAEQISRAGSVWNPARQRPSRPLMAREGSGRSSLDCSRPPSMTSYPGQERSRALCSARSFAFAEATLLLAIGLRPWPVSLADRRSLRLLRDRFGILVSGQGGIAPAENS